jgi:hypothetical protein
LEAYYAPHAEMMLSCTAAVLTQYLHLRVEANLPDFHPSADGVRTRRR